MTTIIALPPQCGHPESGSGRPVGFFSRYRVCGPEANRNLGFMLAAKTPARDDENLEVCLLSEIVEAP
jgi:hypothetical protein